LRILIIALSGIGDALMFTPALKALKESYPGSQIDALVMFKGVEDIYSRLEEINKVYFHDYLKASKLSSLLFSLSLRNKYDISINVYPANRKEYNLISSIIGAKKRAAVKYLRQGSSNLAFLNNVLVEENDTLHNVEENLRMVEALTGKTVKEKYPLNFPLKIEEAVFADDLLKKYAISEKDFVIGFHPGCATLKNHTKRRWEPAKFGELGKMLIKEKNVKILIFGGPDEIELKETVLYKINSSGSFTVDTDSLAQTAAVMKRCNLFVTNDSSLMHVASALKLTTIALIGPTNTNYIHPWQTNYKIASLNMDCAPCFHYSPKPLMCTRTDLQFKCIKELDVQSVYRLAKEYI
jgi:heptosyltransferase II